MKQQQQQTTVLAVLIVIVRLVVRTAEKVEGVWVEDH